MNKCDGWFDDEHDTERPVHYYYIDRQDPLVLCPKCEEEFLGDPWTKAGIEGKKIWLCRGACQKGRRTIVYMEEYIERHIEWSRATFGDGAQAGKLCNHIAKELDEIRSTPTDLTEWVDVIILAIDGAWRAGYTSPQIVDAMLSKQRININRQWALGDGEQPNEHIKVQNDKQ